MSQSPIGSETTVAWMRARRYYREMGIFDWLKPKTEAERLAALAARSERLKKSALEQLAKATAEADKTIRKL